MNINLAIKEGSKILKSKFIPNPLLDAEILMAKTINKDRNYILLNSSSPIKKNDLNNCFNSIFLVRLILWKDIFLLNIDESLSLVSINFFLWSDWKLSI